MPILDRQNAVLNDRAGQDAGLYGEDVFTPRGRGEGAELDTGARTCGAADCASGWIKPWRSRKRPLFEEEWGCSGKCLKSMVRAAIRRETGEAGVDVPHRHRVPLGAGAAGAGVDHASAAAGGAAGAEEYGAGADRGLAGAGVRAGGGARDAWAGGAVELSGAGV